VLPGHVMTKAIPIEKYMTSGEHTVGAEQTLTHAAAVMKQHNIRHCPFFTAASSSGSSPTACSSTRTEWQRIDP